MKLVSLPPILVFAVLALVSGTNSSAQPRAPLFATLHVVPILDQSGMALLQQHVPSF